jgi:predicted site-specific integrase-resolvase
MPDERRPREWTVNEYAALERVDPRTVRRWIDKGALEIRKTPGGGIRIRGEAGAAVASLGVAVSPRPTTARSG